MMLTSRSNFDDGSELHLFFNMGETFLAQDFTVGAHVLVKRITFLNHIDSLLHQMFILNNTSLFLYCSF